MKRIREGFTLIEIAISMLFVGILSLSVVVVVNNAIQAYQRGATLTRIDNTGNNLVDDIRNSIQDSATRTELGKNVSITRTGTIKIDGSEQADTPLYGAFCTGEYTYVWNSGYFFSGDVEFVEPASSNSYAKIRIDKGDETNSEDQEYINNGELFRLVKIKDEERSICLSSTYKDGGTMTADLNLNHDFILNEQLQESPSETITILSDTNSNDLAIYDLSVTVPATNASENLSLYAVSFILGTTSSGVNVLASGDYCSNSIGGIGRDNNCAINKFSFVAQSRAADISQAEIDWTPSSPTPPSQDAALTCYKRYRLEQADGSYTDFTQDGAEVVEKGGSCTYEKAVEGYNNNSPLSKTATDITSDVTLSLDFRRNQYNLNVVAGTNTSNPSGSGTYRWGQIVPVSITKPNNGTCSSYDGPTWSLTSGTVGTFSSTTGTSITYTMGMGDSTITANSNANTIAQTITFKTVNANSITLNGNTKTNNQTLSINCGTYSLTGNIPSNYQFANWSATNGNIANSNSLNTTYEVAGSATITLTANSTPLTITYFGNGGKTSSNATNTTQTVYKGIQTKLASNPFTYASHTFVKWNTQSDGKGVDYSDGQLVTLTNNLTLYAIWSGECPSGFEEWTPGLCWRTSDQSGLLNQNEAQSSCSNNGWRLPTANEYSKLVDTYCDSAYAGGTWYCTANTVTPKGFGYNGVRIKEPSTTCDTLKSQCETSNQNALNTRTSCLARCSSGNCQSQKTNGLNSCQSFKTQAEAYRSIPTVYQIYMNQYNSCVAEVNKQYNSCVSSANNAYSQCTSVCNNTYNNSVSDCTSKYNSCMSNLSDTMIYLGEKGGYWASEFQYVMVLQKDGNDSSVVVGKDVWNVATNTADTHLSTRCVVNSN